MAFRSNRKASYATLGLFVLLTGCGLSEYEANMASEQARVRRIDEENKYLDDPIDWPAKRDDKKEPDKNYADIFLRPPRGISRKPNAKQHGMLYVFPRSSDNTGGILEIWIGTVVNQSGFADDVVKLLVPGGKWPASPNRLEMQPSGRKEPLLIDNATFDDAGSTYSINLYKKGNAQVAVVFHLEKTKSAETTTKVERSLESLAVDGDAAEQRRAFNLYHPKGHGK